MPSSISCAILQHSQIFHPLPSCNRHQKHYQPLVLVVIDAPLLLLNATILLFLLLPPNMQCLLAFSTIIHTSYQSSSVTNPCLFLQPSYNSSSYTPSLSAVSLIIIFHHPQYLTALPLFLVLAVFFPLYSKSSPTLLTDQLLLFHSPSYPFLPFLQYSLK